MILGWAFLSVVVAGLIFFLVAAATHVPQNSLFIYSGRNPEKRYPPAKG